jgi:hypothetical protein
LAATPDQPASVDAAAKALALLERMTIENALSGAQGQNRATAFLTSPCATIVRLYKRVFVVYGISRRPFPPLWNWKISVVGQYQFAEKALSSLLVGDCETYQGLPRVSRSLFRRSESFPQEASLATVRGRTHGGNP